MSAADWVERREGALFWRVDRAVAEPLAALGWPDWSAVERALRAGDAGSGRTATAILALPERAERIHLRPVRHGGLLAPLWRGAILGLARPLSELRASEALRAAGAPVPRPLLVVAQRAHGPFWSAVVGTQHIEDAHDGIAWLGAQPAPAAIVRGARAAGTAIRRFHDAGGWHADLQIKNLLLRDRGGALEVFVIDLDRARAGAPPGPARRMRELMRLVRALHKRGLAERVGARGCAAGFAAYCAGDRGLRRALLAHLPRERRRIARHAWAYRAG